MQCAVDIKSLQPWAASVGSIPYMVVAEELLRLATFTTEFDIKAVIADRVAYCFEVVCEYVQKDLRGSSDMINNSDTQTFSNILGLGQKFVDEVLTIKGGWFHNSCELVDLQARRSQRGWSTLVVWSPWGPQVVCHVQGSRQHAGRLDEEYVGRSISITQDSFVSDSFQQMPTQGYLFKMII